MLDYLPDGVVAEILWRLPINSIIRCSCTCKSLYSLIRSPNLISLHLHKTLLSKSTQLFLHQFDDCPTNNISLLFDNQDHIQSMKLHLPTDPVSSFRIAGSCNGLVCLFHVQSHCKFILCNPSIRHSLPLPTPNFIPGRVSVWLAGFGFDDRNHDYKILIIVKYYFDDWAAEIYSLNSNCWRENIASLPKISTVFNRSAAFVNGGLHWVVRVANEKNLPDSDLQDENFCQISNTNSIIVFDVKDETFCQISVPESLLNPEYEEFSVKEFRESSIALIHQNWCEGYESHVWVMKEYGKKESWIKLATVGKQWTEKSEVLGFRNDFEVLIRLASGRLASQKLNKNSVKNLMKVAKRKSFSLHKYVYSLLLLDKESYGAIEKIEMK